MATYPNDFVDLTLERILILDAMHQGLSYYNRSYNLDRDIWSSLSYHYFIQRYEDTRNKNFSEEIWIERVTYVYPWFARIPIKNIKRDSITELANLEHKYFRCHIYKLKNLDENNFSQQVAQFVELSNDIIQYGTGRFNFPTTSKLLHFMFPYLFPVFDAHICRILYGNEQVDDLNKYLSYMLALQNYLSQGTFSHMIMQEAEQTNMSPLRVIDLKLMNPCQTNNT